MNAPSEDQPDWMAKYNVDKIAHVIAYAVFTFLLLRDEISPYLVLLGCFFFGLGLEFLQGRYFETRLFEIFDLFANISGSILGIGIFKLLKRTE